MAIRITPGTYRARASGCPRTTKHGEKQTPAISATMLITEESPFKGTYMPWVGWLTTDKAKERTAEALLAMGWNGDQTNLESAQSREVYIVVDDEEYNGEIKSVIKFINDPERPGSATQAMDASQQQAALAELRGLVLAKKEQRAKTAPATASKAAADSFDFGANAPAAGSPAPSAPNAKAGF